MDTYEQQIGKVGNRLSVITVDDQTKAAAEAQLKQQFRIALGDERYRDYELSQDASSRSMTQVAQRFNIPAETIAQAIELQKSMQQMAPRTTAGQPFAPEDQQRLAQMAQDAEAKMTQLLGEQAFKAIRSWRPAGPDVFDP